MTTSACNNGFLPKIDLLAVATHHVANFPARFEAKPVAGVHSLAPPRHRGRSVKNNCSVHGCGADGGAVQASELRPGVGMKNLCSPRVGDIEMPRMSLRGAGTKNICSGLLPALYMPPRLPC
jgi:hypothetical protein